PAVIIPPLAASLVARVKLPPLAGCFWTLLQEAELSDGTPEQLADRLSGVPEMTELLIRSAAPPISSRRSRRPLVNAIDTIGCQRSIDLLLTRCLIDAQRGLLHKLAAPFREWYLRRSLVISCAAGILARRYIPARESMARVLGGLQEFGTLVLANTLGA